MNVKKINNKSAENINSKKLKKDFFRYTIPSVLSMWVSALYIMIDGIFVSKGVGAEALASVNITVPFVNLIFGLSVLFSIGTSSVTSSILGKKDNKKASEYFSMSIVFLTLLSIVLVIFSFLFLDKICLILGAGNSTFEMVKDYLSIIIFFSPFYIISYALEVLIKVDGYPNLSVVGVLISAITNIVLDYVFVFIFNWGVLGAGLATGLARLFSFLFFAVHFIGKKSTLKFCKFKFEFNFIKKIASIGVSDCVTELSIGIIILLFNQCIIATLGDFGLITYSVISYINTLVLSTMLGVSQGLQPLSSYHNGNGNSEAIKKLLSISIKVVSVLSLAILIICLFFGEFIVLMFIDKSDLSLFEYTVKAFRVFSLSFALVGFNVVTSGLLASLEKTKEAGIISMSRGFFVIFISLITSISLFGSNGIWISTIISELIVLAFSVTKIKQLLKAI